MKSLSYRAMCAGILCVILILVNNSTYAKEGEASQPVVPLLFVENKGQIIDQYKAPRRDIDFRVSAGGVNIFIGDGALHYQWTETKGLNINPTSGRVIHNKELMSGKGVETHTYRLDVELVGANISASLKAENENAYHEIYYLPQCEAGTSARSYERLVYSNVYPGIDWILYTDGRGRLKYDFVVHAGADPSRIKLRYAGATGLKLTDGALTAITPMGTVHENKPYSYNATGKQEVPSSFVLTGEVLSFDIEQSPYDVIIDPQLDWSTYVGAPGTEFALCAATSPIGDGYIGGMTTSQLNFATWGAHQYVYGGFNQDGFVAKLRTDGVTEWISYYGGSGYDQVNDITCDRNGNVYFTGVTTSTGNISTSGTHQFIHPGGQGGYEMEQAFLVRFNTNGGRIWGTYYGSNRIDIPYTVACDWQGNVFMGGYTESKGTDSIATTGAARTTYAPGFLVKFNPNGGRIWGTYVGDTGVGQVSGIAADFKGNVYCVGLTSSYRNIATAGSHQSANGGGTTGVVSYEDGFLMKFDVDGHLKWGTYYGGSNYDAVTTVACDDRGGVYIGGKTSSANGTSIATSGSFQATLASTPPDGFIAKFRESGVREWGTYYGMGGAWEDDIRELQVLPNGSLFATGTRLQPSQYYAFVLKLNRLGQRVWYQDNVCDNIYASLGYNDGKLYFAGTSADLVPRSTNHTMPQGVDPLVIRYWVDTALFIPQPYTDSMYCVGDTMKIPFDVTNKFNSGNVVTLQMSDASGNFSNGITLTTRSTDTGGIFSYVIPDTVAAGSGYKLRLIGSTPVDTSLDNIYSIRISNYPNVGPVAIFPICANGTLQMTDTGTSPTSTSYTWTGPGGFSVGTQQYNRPNVQSSDSGWYVLEGENFGCINRDSVFVQVYPKPAKPTFITNSPVCEGDTLKIKANSPSLGVSKYNWAFYQGGGTTPIWYLPEINGDTVIFPAKRSDTGRHTVVALAGGCPSDASSLNIVVGSKSAPTVQIGANPSAFLGPWQAMTFSVTGFSNSGTAPTYQWKKNGADIPGATGSTFMGTTGLDLQTGDTICVEMKSSEPCATPQIATSCVGIEIDLGIKKTDNAEGLRLYPNPNTGRFTLQADAALTGADIIIKNSLGQEVFKESTRKGDRAIEINLGDMPAGIYFLHTELNGRYINMKFVLTDR